MTNNYVNAPAKSTPEAAMAGQCCAIVWGTFLLSCVLFWTHPFLGPALGLYALSGFGALGTLILGITWWHKGGRIVVLGSSVLLALWIGIVVLGYIALSHLRLF